MQQLVQGVGFILPVVLPALPVQPVLCNLCDSELHRAACMNLLVALNLQTAEFSHVLQDTFTNTATGANLGDAACKYDKQC